MDKWNEFETNDVKIKFTISLPGLCFQCDNKPIFSLYAPDDWKTMTDEQKAEWAKETFFEEMSWDWYEY